MAKSPKKEAKREDASVPQMPFDEALKRVWSAPPAPKVAKKKAKKKK